MSDISAVFDLQLVVSPILVPVGISFITFSNISFLVEESSYQESISVFDYLLYIFFFPKVLAGPICTPNEMITQFRDLAKKSVDWTKISKGLYCFSIGLAKKVLVADFLGIIVDYTYSNVWSCSGIEAILAVFAYSFQIYFDFSGYSDMAIGIALMLNIDIPQNFNSPYQAVDIIDFWKRWHITLTNFLTRYVYYPLGGNRKGKFRQYINILIVFLISGIWHGVGLTFIVWGLLHGLINVFTRILKKYINIWKPVGISFNFIIVTILWVFFRAPSIDSALYVLSRPFTGFGSINADLIESLLQPTIFSITAHLTSLNIALVILFVVLAVLTFFFKNSTYLLTRFRPTIKTVILTVFLLTLSTLSFTGVSSFIYAGF